MGWHKKFLTLNLIKTCKNWHISNVSLGYMNRETKETKYFQIYIFYKKNILHHTRTNLLLSYSLAEKKKLYSQLQL